MSDQQGWDGQDRRQVPYCNQVPQDTKIPWTSYVPLLALLGVGLGSYVSLQTTITELKLRNEFMTTSLERHKAEDQVRYEKMSADVNEHRKDHDEELKRTTERIRDLESTVANLYNKLNDRSRRTSVMSLIAQRQGYTR